MRLLLVLLTLLLGFGCTADQNGTTVVGPQPPPTAVGPTDPTGAAEFFIDFHQVKAGSTASWPIRLRNPGAEKVAIRVEGAAPPFGFTAGSTVPGGGSLEVQFTFAPEARGTWDGTATILAGEKSWTVRLTGAGYTDPACVANFESGPIDFGRVAPGGYATVRLPIENIGDAPCTVSASPTEGIFSVLEPAEVKVWPGKSRVLQFRAAPLAPGRSEGELLLQVESETHPLPAHVEQVERCVTWAGTTDFGDVIPGCFSEIKTLTFTNGCAGDLVVDSSELSAGRDFAIQRRSSPIVPAGGAYEVALFFRPKGGDPAREVALRLVADRESPVVRLTGRLAAPPIQEDHFEQPSRPRLDLLLVVDDSPAMQPYLPALREWTHTVASAASADRFDVRAAVTTTSLVATEGCAGSGADGRFLPFDGSGPRFVSGDDGDLGAAIEAHLPARFCSEAPNQGLDAAIRAVAGLGGVSDDTAHEEPDDGNLGFRRSDAALVVLFATARDDASESDPATWANSAGLSRNPLFIDPYTLFATSSCDVETSGLRYQAAMAATSGSMWLGCGRPWPFEPYGSGGHSTRFYLTQRPVDVDGDGWITDAAGELEVLVDGVPVPARGSEGITNWSVNAWTNVIDFLPGHEPPPGSELIARYAWASCG